MPADEREKRHRHNYAHVTTHTAQDWAETFVRQGSSDFLNRTLQSGLLVRTLFDMCV